MCVEKYEAVTILIYRKINIMEIITVGLELLPLFKKKIGSANLLPLHSFSFNIYLNNKKDNSWYKVELVVISSIVAVS